MHEWTREMECGSGNVEHIRSCNRGNLTSQLGRAASVKLAWQLAVHGKSCAYFSSHRRNRIEATVILTAALTLAAAASITI